MTLLRPGGLCCVVVPDGVISAKGLPAYLRQRIVQKAVLRGIIELPAVTFAQAGTRTKTAILVLQKLDKESPLQREVFFGEAEDLGFEVSKRKGATIKYPSGRNQLPDILRAYKKTHLPDGDEKRAFAIWREVDLATFEAWTPRRFKTDFAYARKSAETEWYLLKELSDLVEAPERRRSQTYSDETYFISVLHVIGEGVLDIAGIKSYTPITPGTPINPGEVIISRLNPRIPRVIVVPDLGRPLLCSTEFEVLRPKKGISPHALSYLLLHQVVQEQLLSLTAGTSASHSRVKPDRIYKMQVPWPAKAVERAFNAMIAEYASSLESLLNGLLNIHRLRRGEDKRLGVVEARITNIG